MRRASQRLRGRVAEQSRRRRRGIAEASQRNRRGVAEAIYDTLSAEPEGESSGNDWWRGKVAGGGERHA